MQNLPQELQTVLKEIALLHVEFSKKNRLDSFGKLNLLAKKNGIVFVGDSITEGFPLYEMYQGSKPIYNRGISGYTSLELLENLQEMVCDLEPSTVVLLIGTNDLGIGNKPEEIIQRIEQICSDIKGKLPYACILVQSIYPIRNTEHHKVASFFESDRNNEEIRRLNAMIYEMSNQLGLKYIDLYSKLGDKDGSLKINFTTDGLHLSIEGYEMVYDELKKHF
ncbi:GDSL-type esterase/lipase family protein [Paenibacillus andongensis]|uniref:GDSL-type esterase/lipase family protein n=1 Tax=Paenibacillus andongensis TaxID=2975482 RepID=UPI0021BA7CBB|nr:GDSL-type esterase/lipase family protein [Paenibacillus andongensis]